MKIINPDFKTLMLELWDGLLDLVYPSNIYCISCGNIIDDSRPYALCDFCVATLHWANEKTCEKCGKVLPKGIAHSFCTDCTQISHAFEKGFACVQYARAERDLIHSFKYKDKAYLGRKLAEMMYDRIMVEEDLSFDLIIPVPMFKKKERKRGYNQAEILARSLGKLMGLPCNSKILKRTLETEPMSNLGAKERRENIKNAFTIDKTWVTILRRKTILLVDDVYTTGSTADACTESLLDAGATKVYLLTFATGGDTDFVLELPGSVVESPGQLRAKGPT